MFKLAQWLTSTRSIAYMTFSLLALHPWLCYSSMRITLDSDSRNFNGFGDGDYDEPVDIRLRTHMSTLRTRRPQGQLFAKVSRLSHP